jgi:hypothetical protein
MNKQSAIIAFRRLMNRPVGRIGLLLLVLVICTGPAVLFFDPAPSWPGSHHVRREPFLLYHLHSDDVAYVAAARSWQRTLSNLFVPHNTHVVPAWRLTTWALTACAGNLERVTDVLAVASYSIVVAVMLMLGSLVARETGRVALGLAAMAFVGTTSLMFVPATWYSAGQPLWAGLAILSTLWYAQSYRRTGQTPALLLSVLSAPAAGWFWTVGHLAGPVAAVYLWADGRRRCRTAAAAVFGASAVAAAFSVALTASRIGSTVSFHGRSIREAFSLHRGLLHTLQAIPENMVFGNLGLAVQSTQAQGALMTAGLVALWLGTSRLKRKSSPDTAGEPNEVHDSRANSWAITPLEWAGAALLCGSYLMEWSFRGYLDFRYLRTINMHSIVPWYDLVPQIGAVLLGVSWFSRIGVPADRRPVAAMSSLTTKTGLGLLALLVILVVLHRPRVEALVRASTPRLLPSEYDIFRITRLQTYRANVLLMNQAEWQRSALRRLDHAEEVARRMRLGQDAIRAAFGHVWLPAAVGIVPAQLNDLYDVTALLNLPAHGQPTDPKVVRAALSTYIVQEREPRPSWLPRKETWPPADLPGTAK